jgi:hypothetical protein
MSYKAKEIKQFISHVKEMGGYTIYENVTYKDNQWPNDDMRYGYVVDNNNPSNFLYWQGGNYGGIAFSMELIPDKRHGSGLHLADGLSQYISKERLQGLMEGKEGISEMHHLSFLNYRYKDFNHFVSKQGKDFKIVVL